MSSSRVCVCSPDRLEAVSQVWEVLLVWEVLEFLEGAFRRHALCC